MSIETISQERMSRMYKIKRQIPNVVQTVRDILSLVTCFFPGAVCSFVLRLSRSTGELRGMSKVTHTRTYTHTPSREVRH